MGGSASGARLVGVELVAVRPGHAAEFYAWLLGPASGTVTQDWNAISLLFSHGVSALRTTHADGPPPSWVPVVAVPDVGAALARGVARGFTTRHLDDAVYLVRDRLWVRLVPGDRVPVEVDPDALGRTTVEWQTAGVRDVVADLCEVLDLAWFEVVDDPDDYHLLASEGVIVTGVVDIAEAGLPPSWLVYFEVPDLPLTLERARGAGVRTLVQPVDEEFAEWALLLDPFDAPVALCSYADLAASDRRVRDATGAVAAIGERLSRS